MTKNTVGDLKLFKDWKIIQYRCDVCDGNFAMVRPKNAPTCINCTDFKKLAYKLSEGGVFFKEQL